MRPNPHIALIYHYDLARALDGEPVDWQAIPVNVDAGREGGDLCRAAADFAKRRDLFAMPAPRNADPTAQESGLQVDQAEDARSGFAPEAVPGDDPTRAPSSADFAAPAAPNAVGQPVAEPEPVAPARSAAHGSATNDDNEEPCGSTTPTSDPTTSAPTTPAPASMSLSLLPTPNSTSTSARSSGSLDAGPTFPFDRDRLRARIADLITNPEAERFLRRHWPIGVPPLSKPGHTDDELAAILAAVRRVETEVGAPWHPDDGPPPHVNTDPRAEVVYPVAVAVDEGGLAGDDDRYALTVSLAALTDDQRDLCSVIAGEAHAAGRSISVSANPTVRRWTIARAVIAWAASGRTVDDLWFTASLLATHQQTCDADATLGGLISQFTIEQGERLYAAAQSPQ